MISLDTETTGVDLHHGAKPFFVTTCDEDGNVTSWEWDVDPLTREPQIPEGDLQDIADHCFAAGPNKFVLQNPKFDIAALNTVGFWELADLPTVWPDVLDTLLAGHLLASNRPHNLTDMVLEMLGVDIEPFELALKEACTEARRIARKEFPDWQIAEKGLPCMPSAKDHVWKYDSWLPRRVAQELDYDEDHPWWTVLSKYANTDSSMTLLLWKAQYKEIMRRGLWEIYQERLKVLPIAYKMEQRGVTMNLTRLRELEADYKADSDRAGKLCVNIAASYGHELELPKNGVNNSLRTLCFEKMKLPQIRNPKAKTDAPTLDAKNAIPYYLQNLPPKSKELKFIKALAGKRRRDTSLTFFQTYQRFWLPLGVYNAKGEQLWYKVYPNLNPTGTDTLRWSSSNPNEQQISKKEMPCLDCFGIGCEACDYEGEDPRSVRYAFGPGPGREWWSLDAKNIERRIPAYYVNEEAIIALFERPDDPPYYGSEHLLIAHLLFPKQFEECLNDKGELDGRIFKKRYAATHYQDTKNGNFAVQYGAVDRPDGKGTADRTYKVPGAHAKIKARFAKQTELNNKLIAYANKHGYVETIPDKSVNPKRGYPLLCARTEWNDILPTTPLNYWGQGTAMWWTMKAMIRTDEKLTEWQGKGFDGFLVLQVHDECVFDFPKAAHPKKDPKRSNLWRIRVIQKLMEKGGEDIGIPTPVGCEYHENNWAEGVSL